MVINMKKSTVLLALLLLTVFAGCGNKQDELSTTDGEITVSADTESEQPEPTTTPATTAETPTTTETEPSTEETPTTEETAEDAPPATEPTVSTTAETSATSATVTTKTTTATQPPAVSANEQKAIQTCENLGLTRDTSINYNKADFAWGYALYGDEPIKKQVEQMQCNGYYNYFKHTDGYYYVGLVFDLSKPKPGATWVFNQSDVDWIIEEAKKYTESLGMTYYPRGEKSNKDNGSWSGQIRNLPESSHTNSREGVLEQICGQIDLWKSIGSVMITIDYQLMTNATRTTFHQLWGDGLYEFYVIYG